MNRCNKCNEEKELKLFPIRNDNNKPRNTCKQCYSIYQNDRAKNIRKQRGLKQSGPDPKKRIELGIKKICTICLEQKDIAYFNKKKNGLRAECKK